MREQIDTGKYRAKKDAVTRITEGTAQRGGGISKTPVSINICAWISGCWYVYVKGAVLPSETLLTVARVIPPRREGREQKSDTLPNPTISEQRRGPTLGLRDFNRCFGAQISDQWKCEMTTGRGEDNEERGRATDQSFWHGQYSHILVKILIFNMMRSFSHVMNLECRPYLRNDFEEI